MPFHMRFEADDLLRCRFGVSPLWETHQALYTLLRPRRHVYHLPWLRRMREPLASLDVSWLSLVVPDRGYHPDFLCPPPSGPLDSFEDELARVRATAPARAREELARSLAETPGAADSARGRAMLADPAGAVRELTAALEQAWHTVLAPDWPRLRALLEADVVFHARRLAEGGLERLFADLHPSLNWADNTLTIRRPGHHSRRLGGRGLMLVPSVFTWPEVIGGFDPPWQATLVYPARGIGGLWHTPPPAASDDALSRLLGPNRAALLTTLDEPASTTTLADRHGLALSSVSAHLRVLRDAGLLTSRREGHRVLYERTPLGTALLGGAARPHLS
ncbi:ArsR/SmtB family transcription factor [Streptomyces abikoensis]|uniref:ArsR/SmtB family transcription factor n=1 Tax=Streptomyces abikoensis TaxID=97398 RepID=UPI0033D3A4B7